MSNQYRHSRRSALSKDYHSFVVRVGVEDQEGSDSPAKISIRVQHVNVNAVRYFVSRVGAFNFISNAIDEFVLHSTT